MHVNKATTLQQKFRVQKKFHTRALKHHTKGHDAGL